MPHNIETGTNEDGDEASYEVTHEEIVNFLRRMKGRKAPGFNGLTGTMVKKIFSMVPEFIVAILNKCFLDGVFPEQWKTAKAIILLKSPDKPKTQPRSYKHVGRRQICLLPTWSKLLERLMVERLAEDIQSNDRVSAKQYGFTAGKSTQDA